MHRSANWYPQENIPIPSLAGLLPLPNLLKGTTIFILSTLRKLWIPGNIFEEIDAIVTVVCLAS
jgi:hypothetical protein